ncbi:MAG: tetratricopeptide repeat protein [Nitrospinae bacterium]|nr:tetratricopeptide repeat protein [Nitrospinota bacterium]MZH04602.1 tetratricopeptide repeat protein [Nitrospinota bacterium]
MEKIMPPVTLLSRLVLVIFLSFPFFIGGCSYLPWIGDEEDDLAFEEDFPFEDDEFVDESPRRGRGRKARRERSVEDDFFAEDDSMSDSDRMEGDDFGDEDPDGFASVDQDTDRGELKGDVESLQNQQEALISKVRELEEMLSTLEPKIDAATERIEGGVSSATDSADFLEPEVEDLKAQMARLNEEIARIKRQKSASPRMHRSGKRRSKMKTPPEYDRALAAYRSRNYDESILLFQNLALSDPPNQLKDNIAFWIGSNYLALEMYDDAILQFETVLNKYPRGNKVHDSRYMLGVSYSKKGETSRAIEVLEGALKRNPTAEVRGKILAQLNQIQ